jgi:hypothetical protein
VVTRIAPSEEESKAGVFSSRTLEKASYCLRTDGTLIVEDIVGQKLIQDAREAFFQRYHRYLDGRKHHDARQVGEGRVMITVDLEPPFERRELVANPWLLPLLNAAFDGDFVLGAFGVVCSLPGAGPQGIHQDGGDIFPQATLNRLLPIVAVTVAFPLIEMNDVHGTTALWPGSHRDDKLASAEKGHEPLVREGSCVFWDYRLRHGGTPNRSEVSRPLLTMTYCRSWFVDPKNYHQQAPLRAPKGFRAELPEDLRRLLVRAQGC